jgi:hypothetical protein
MGANKHLLGFGCSGKPRRTVERYDDERNIQFDGRCQTISGLLHYRTRRPSVADFHDPWRL